MDGFCLLSVRCSAIYGLSFCGLGDLTGLVFVENQVQALPIYVLYL